MSVSPAFIGTWKNAWRSFIAKHERVRFGLTVLVRVSVGVMDVARFLRHAQFDDKGGFKWFTADVCKVSCWRSILTGQ